MNRRRATAVLALLGALDAIYLLLGKLGVIGTLECSISHSCDMVNASAYSEFLGLPVAGIGVVGYSAIFVIALMGQQPRWLGERWPDQLLALLSGVALVFTVYLTYAELFILHAICQWCVLSQVAILAIFVLALFGLRRGANIQHPASK